MRSICYGLIALLILPVTVLLGAQGIKKLKNRPVDSTEAPPPKVKPPKPTPALAQGPFESDEERKADIKANKVIAQFDLNGDGVLEAEELPPKWGARAMAHDSNGDGRLDRAELTAFYLAAEEVKKARKAEKKAAVPPVPPPPPSAPPPVVYRPGKLPGGLPQWFAELDTDGDAQVGLYEWRSANRDLDEFIRLDLNEDGFITVEEVRRAQRRP